jgi:hypothetical protein
MDRVTSVLCDCEQKKLKTQSDRGQKSRYFQTLRKQTTVVGKAQIRAHSRFLSDFISLKAIIQEFVQT